MGTEKKGWSIKGIGLKGENLNVSDLIGRQMDRVLQSLGMGREEFFNQLEGLEAVCELIGLDDEYITEMKSIDKDFKADFKKLINSRAYVTDPQKGMLMVRMAMRRFRSISRRIKRSGIAPKEEIDLILE